MVRWLYKYIMARKEKKKVGQVPKNVTGGLQREALVRKGGGCRTLTSGATEGGHVNIRKQKEWVLARGRALLGLAFEVLQICPRCLWIGVEGYADCRLYKDKTFGLQVEVIECATNN